MKNLNFNNGLNLLAITITMLSLTACSSKKNSSAATVNTSLTMTGSSQASTIAKSGFWESLLFPKAIANTPPTLLDSSGATVVLNSAWVVLKEIEFKTVETAGAAEAAEISLTGPYYVNLVSPAAETLGSVTIPEAAYHRIKFKLHKVESALPAGVPAGLSTHSIMIEGSVAGASFTYLADDSAEVSISGAHGVTPNSTAGLLIAVNVGDLLKKINLSGITTTTTISASNRVSGTNLCPSIDASATDLYTCFRKGIETEAKFGRDDDGDHELGGTEEDVEKVN